jgi:hypothetical protein
VKVLCGIAALAAFTISGGVEAQRKPAAHTAAKPVVKSSAARPDFTFKEAHAGSAMDPSVVGTCTPTDDGIAGKLECRGKDSVVAGVDLGLAPSYYFYNNRLTSMIYLYDNDGIQFLTFLSAFREKYGAACSTSTPKWQNKAGSTFENTTVSWCFKTGKLTLERMGPSMKYGVVTYTDDVSGPSKSTPKDF